MYEISALSDEYQQCSLENPIILPYSPYSFHYKYVDKINIMINEDFFLN